MTIILHSRETMILAITTKENLITSKGYTKKLPPSVIYIMETHNG